MLLSVILLGVGLVQCPNSKLTGISHGTPHRYPACYIVLVLPISIRRWIGFDSYPSAATFFGTSLFGLSGLVNVVLLLVTRR